MQRQRIVRSFLALCVLLVGFGLATSSAWACPGPEVSAADGPKLIELNTATQDQLETLPGIGPAIAERILVYAKSPGFQTVDDLLNVKGIGDKKLAKIRPLVTVVAKASPKKPADK